VRVQVKALGFAPQLQPAGVAVVVTPGGRITEMLIASEPELGTAPMFWAKIVI